MSLAEIVIAALNQNVFYSLGSDVRDDRKTAEFELSDISKNPYADLDQYVFRVYDALAQILVSEGTGEVIAIGSAVTEDGLTLYVASNGTTRLDPVRTQLVAVWNLLQKIEDEREEKKRKEIGVELRRLVYTYHKDKFLHRCSKGKNLRLADFYKAILEKGSSYVLEEAPQEGNDYILREELKFIKLLKGVNSYVDQYNKKQSKTKPEQFIANLVILLMHLADTFKRKQFLTNNSGSPFLSRCDVIVATLLEKKNIRGRKPAAFRRYCEKLLTVEHSIQELLRFSKDSKMQKILREQVMVTCVVQDKFPLSYNLAKRDNEPLRMLVESLNKPWQDFLNKWIVDYPSEAGYSNKEAHAHCECALLTHFLENDIRAYGYIGVSKLSCVGCSLYFQAYKNVAKKKGMPVYYTHGTHSKAYKGWLKPRLKDAALDGEISNELLGLATKKLAEALEPLTSARKSDSTDASEISDDNSDSAYVVDANGGEEEMLRIVEKLDNLVLPSSSN